MPERNDQALRTCLKFAPEENRNGYVCLRGFILKASYTTTSSSTEYCIQFQVGLLKGNHFTQFAKLYYFQYRSINHKVDENCLRLYRQYHSTAVQV